MASPTTASSSSSSTRPPRPRTPIQLGLNPSSALPCTTDAVAAETTAADLLSSSPAMALHCADGSLRPEQHLLEVSTITPSSDAAVADQSSSSSTHNSLSSPKRRSFRVSPSHCPGSPSTSLLKRSATFKAKNRAKEQDDFLKSPPNKNYKAVSAPLPLSVVALLELEDEADPGVAAEADSSGVDVFDFNDSSKAMSAPATIGLSFPPRPAAAPRQTTSPPSVVSAPAATATAKTTSNRKNGARGHKNSRRRQRKATSPPRRVVSGSGVSAATMELLNQSSSSLFSVGGISTTSMNTTAKRTLVIEKVVQQAQIRLVNRKMLHDMRNVLMKEAQFSSKRRLQEREVKSLLAIRIQARIRGYLCRCRHDHVVVGLRQKAAVVPPVPLPRQGSTTTDETPTSSAHVSSSPTTTTDEFEMDSFAFGDPNKLRTEKELDPLDMRRSRHKLFTRQTSDVTMSDFGDSVTSFGWGDGSSHHNTNNIINTSRHGNNNPQSLSPSHHTNLNLEQNTIPEYDNFHASFTSFAEFGGDDDDDEDDEDEDGDEVSYDVMKDLYSQHRQRQKQHQSKGGGVTNHRHSKCNGDGADHEDDDLTIGQGNNRSASSLPVYSNHAVTGSPHRHSAVAAAAVARANNKKKNQFLPPFIGGYGVGAGGFENVLAGGGTSSRFLTPNTKSKNKTQEAGHMSFSSYFLQTQGGTSSPTTSSSKKNDVPVRPPNRNLSPPNTNFNNSYSHSRYGGSSCGGGSRNTYYKKSCGETVTTATVTTIHTNFTSKPPTLPDLTMVVIPQDGDEDFSDLFVPRGGRRRQNQDDAAQRQETSPEEDDDDEASLGSFARLNLETASPPPRRGRSHYQGTPTMTVEVPRRPTKSQEFLPARTTTTNYTTTAQRYNASLSSFKSSDIPIRRPRRRLTPEPVGPTSSSELELPNTKSSSFDVSIDTHDDGFEDEVSLGSFPALMRKNRDSPKSLTSPKMSPIASVSPSDQDSKMLMNQFHVSMPLMGSRDKDKPMRRPRRTLTPDSDELKQCFTLEESPPSSFPAMVTGLHRSSPDFAAFSPPPARRRTLSTPKDLRNFQLELEFSSSDSDGENDYDDDDLHLLRGSLSSSPRLMKTSSPGMNNLRKKLSSSPIRQRATSWSGHKSLDCFPSSPFQDGPVRPPQRQRSNDLTELAQ